MLSLTMALVGDDRTSQDNDRQTIKTVSFPEFSLFTVKTIYLISQY